MKAWGRTGSNAKKKIDGEDSDDGSSNVVQSLNNRIFFYSDVSNENILEVNRLLYEIAHENTVKGIGADQSPLPIKLHVNSHGGEIHSGFACMDTILDLKRNVPIHTIVEGCAASAATFISCVGTRRYMRRHSHMLIHQLSSEFWGKFTEIQDQYEHLEELMFMIKNVYKEYTKVPMKEIEAILKRDVWWDAATCKKYGLIDEII